MAQAKEDLARMKAAPMPLERPLIVLGGLNAPRFSLAGIRDNFQSYTTTPGMIVASDYFWANTFDKLRAHTIELVEQQFPSDDPQRTTEVDVLAVSMGGIVARYAAMPIGTAYPRPADACADDDPDAGHAGAETSEPGPVKQLRIRRLFTLATPHRGAQLAGFPTWDQRQRDMRAGSALMKMLDDGLRDAPYELVCYTLTRDELVGERNSYPLAEYLPPQTAWGTRSAPGVHWLPARPFNLSHFNVHADPRVVADILRRLRNEEPWASDETSPLPGGR